MSDYDVVIRNASIVDGTGAPSFEASIGIRGDRIVTVGEISERGAVDLDARNLVVAPGFIDVHSHDDWAVLLTPEMDFKVMQGVTTDIVGNCGMGAAPNPAAAVIFRSLHGPAAKVPEWTDYAGYFRAVDENPPSLNVAVLAGHGSLRLGAMGNAKREPSTGEMATMRGWLHDAIDAGAVGLSTGLIYEPGRYARTEEIIELAERCRVAARFTPVTCAMKRITCSTRSARPFVSARKPASPCKFRITRLRAKRTGGWCASR